MAMPPGGGLAWAHHADGYDLVDEDGAVWGRLTQTIARHHLSMTLPMRDTPFDSFFVFDIDVAAAGDVVTWKNWIPAPRRVRWTSSTTAAELVASAEVFRRASAVRPEPLTELQARLVAEAGAVTVLDALGRARVHVRLGEPDPTWGAGERGVLGVDGGAQVAFHLPTGPGRGVRRTQLSMP